MQGPVRCADVTPCTSRNREHVTVNNTPVRLHLNGAVTRVTTAAIVVTTIVKLTETVTVAGTVTVHGDGHGSG